MASPNLVNSATTGNAAAATSQPLNMPSSVVAGRLLVAYVYNQSAPSMSGWTQIFAVTNGLFLTGFAKIAAGSDTGTVTTSSAVAIGAVVAQYDGWSGSISDIVAATNSSNGDPPLGNPGVSKDWLWVAVLGVYITASGVITGAPTNYSDFATGIGAAGGNGIACGVADRALTASSEDPGVFTSTGTPNLPMSATIAIPPFVPPPPAAGRFFPFFG